jgi:hypothetical protein
MKEHEDASIHANQPIAVTLLPQIKARFQCLRSACGLMHAFLACGLQLSGSV